MVSDEAAGNCQTYISFRAEAMRAAESVSYMMNHGRRRCLFAFAIEHLFSLDHKDTEFRVNSIVFAFESDQTKTKQTKNEEASQLS